MSGIHIWNDIKETVVPSKTTRAYIADLGWKPADWELAYLIYDMDLSLEEKRELYGVLQTQTEDEELAAEIGRFIQEQRGSLLRFADNRHGAFLYEVKRQTYGSLGLFRRLEQAVAAGVQSGACFDVGKAAVFDSADQSPAFTQNWEDVCEGRVVYREDGAPMAIVETGKWATTIFNGGKAEVPNPFEAGDIVCTCTGDTFGIVMTSQQEWKDMYERIGSRVMFIGRGLRVEVLNKWGNFMQSHYSPRRLERVEDTDSAAWSYLREGRDLLLGRGSFERFFSARYLCCLERGTPTLKTPDLLRPGHLDI